MTKQSGVLGMGTLLGGALLFASGQAAAQEQSASASARAMLEEIVVTARRREESLEDLPLSIQAISAEAMQAQGIYNIQALSGIVPNLSLQEDIRSNDNRIFIRGVGGGFSNPAQIFGVGMYVDGHYMSGTLGAFMSTVDVERVEVLRGPQGTLFGKNTTGGAVSIISAKPGPDFDSYVTLRAGEFGQQDFRGMINMPITDTLFFRANYATEQDDGYYTNRLTGQDVGGKDQQSIGLALRWQPNEHWTVDTRLGLAEDRDSNRGGQCFPYPDEQTFASLTGAGYAIPYTGPGPVLTDEASPRWGGTGGGARPGGHIDGLYPGAAGDFLNDCLQNFQSGIYTTSQNIPNTQSNVDNDMINVNAMWDSAGPLGAFDNATIQVQGAWRYNAYYYIQDRDFGFLTVDHVGSYGADEDNGGVNRRTDEFEVIFNGDLSERMTLTTGLYFLDDDAKTGDFGCLSKWNDAYDPVTDTILGQPDANLVCAAEGNTLMPRLPGTGLSAITTTYGRTTGESVAAYAHITYQLTDAWEMAVGARYTKDERTQNNIEIDIEEGFADCFDDGNGWCTPTNLLNRQTVINTGVYVDATGEDDDVTPTLSFSRSLSPGDVLESGNVYFTISEGYLTGAFNDELPVNQVPPENQAALQALIPYEPEFVTNYEVGFKGTLFDGNLRLATALFFMDYTDKHEAIEVSNEDGSLGPNIGLEYTDNVGEVEITGMELELRASPWEGGFVSFDMGLLDYNYKSYEYTDITADPPELVSGVPPISIRTPEWSVTASIEHAFTLGNGGVFTPQLGLYMQDDYEWMTAFPLTGEPFPEGYESANCHQDSYLKARVRMTYEPSDGRWQAALFGYNITDEEVLQGCGVLRTGAYRWYHEAPSQYGAEFTMRFGNNN